MKRAARFKTPRALIAACCAIWTAAAAFGETPLGHFLSDSTDSKDSNEWREAYMSALALYRAGRYADAAREWAELARSSEDEAAAERAQLGRAWAAIRLRDWGAAASHLDRLPIMFPDSELLPRAELLRRQLGDGPRFSKRSPKTAKTLSTFLPGAGQIYAGRCANGVVSALLNGAFFYLLGDSLTEKRWVDSAFIYLIGARFYWGGRQNAAKFARERNERETERFIERLTETMR